MNANELTNIINKFAEGESLLEDSDVVLDDGWELALEALNSLAPNILESGDESVVNSFNIIKEYIKIKNKDSEEPIKEFSL